MITKDEVRSTVEALSVVDTLKLALEALEECRRDPRLKYEHPYYDKTITAIRVALASKSEALAEQPRLLSAAPCDQCGYNGHGYYQPDTHQCAAKHHKALAHAPTEREQPAPVAQVRSTEKPHKQQEPVAWRWENGGEDKWLNKYIYLDNGGPDCPEDCEPLYTSTPANANAGKPWVHATTWRGLTDEQINEFFEGMEPNNGFWLSFGRAIEAKLKEKNGF